MTTIQPLPFDGPATSDRNCSSVSPDNDLRKLTCELLRQEISFIPNRDFLRENAPDASDSFHIRIADSRTDASTPQGLPAHLARLCETELLAADEERDLFRRMNVLKFWANRLRCRLDPDRPDRTTIKRLTRYLEEAEQIRDHLIKSNMRLVLSIARKFVTPQHSFDELLSEGVMCMMHTVEKFDFDRGFRFSTYAYRSISRSLYRSVRGSRKQMSQLGRFDASVADRVEDTSRPELADRVEQQHRELLTELVNRLDRRERFIIRSRFALGAHRKKRTCRELAERLGISKERVRQLEQRAICKIREKVAEERSQKLD